MFILRWCIDASYVFQRFSSAVNDIIFSCVKKKQQITTNTQSAWAWRTQAINNEKRAIKTNLFEQKKNQSFFLILQSIRGVWNTIVMIMITLHDDGGIQCGRQNAMFILWIHFCFLLFCSFRNMFPNLNRIPIEKNSRTNQFCMKFM